MAIPVWTAGQILTSSDINQWLAPNAATKSADQSVTSSTVLQNDNDLVLPVAASASYAFSLFVAYEGGTQGASDLKLGFAIPAGVASFRAGPTYIDSAGGTHVGNSLTSGSTIAAGTNGGGNLRTLEIVGSIITGGTAGNLQITWAQNTSSATATIVHGGSMMVMQRTG